MARKPLGGNIQKVSKAQEAVQVVQAMSGKPAPSGDDYTDAAGNPLYETVSYNLPVELIELVRDLAEERVKVERAEKRALRRQIQAAKRRGEPVPADTPPQARKSASAIVREALEAHRAAIEAELKALSDG